MDTIQKIEKYLEKLNGFKTFEKEFSLSEEEETVIGEGSLLQDASDTLLNVINLRINQFNRIHKKLVKIEEDKVRHTIENWLEIANQAAKDDFDNWQKKYRIIFQGMDEKKVLHLSYKLQNDQLYTLNEFREYFNNNPSLFEKQLYRPFLLPPDNLY
jgi:FtsZ-binding cell division protein ZapB